MKIIKDIIAYFLKGLFFIAPIAVTCMVLVWVVNFLNNLVSPFSLKVFAIEIPGLGIVMAFVWLALLGFLVSQLISHSAIVWFDKLIKRVPLIKVIYFSVKDLTSVFFGKTDKMGKPVMVCVNQAPLQYKLGFITRIDVTEFGFDRDMISVYMPYSYGVMGNQIIVKKDDIKILDVPAAVVMKFIVSGGVIQGEEPTIS